jgi:hypothetical protein
MLSKQQCEFLDVAIRPNLYLCAAAEGQFPEPYQSGRSVWLDIANGDTQLLQGIGEKTSHEIDVGRIGSTIYPAPSGCRDKQPMVPTP